MNYREAIDYLTRCADDNGNHHSGGYRYDAEDCPTCRGTNNAGRLACPGSRYGYTAAHVAPVAYRVARILSREDGSSVTRHRLDYVMAAMVNGEDWPERDVWQYAASVAGADIGAMTEGYLDAQLWAGLDYAHDRCGDSCPKDEPHTWDENYSRGDISDEYAQSVRDEFAALVAEHPIAVRMYLNARNVRLDWEGGEWSSAFGHDFYLTREGHGAGFWDRGLGELGEYLTMVAKAYGAASDLWDIGGILST